VEESDDVRQFRKAFMAKMINEYKPPCIFRKVERESRRLDRRDAYPSIVEIIECPTHSKV
jgi:hypothetical protein